MAVRKESDKFQALYHQHPSSIKATEDLNNILNNQRSPFIKTGLGYEGSSSSIQPENKESTMISKPESNKHSMNTKLMKFIKQNPSNSNVESISGNKGKSEEEEVDCMQKTRKSEVEPIARCNNEG